MLFIGWYFYSRTKNISDYILGGRGLNKWVTSMSAQASDMSGWLLLGLPGYAYTAGIEAFWLASGLIIGTYLNWKFIAKRLRDYTEICNNSITLPDFFDNRFRSKTRVVRIISAIFIIIFFLIYTSSGFVAGAKLFSTVFGISYFWALVAGVFVIISYTFLGGFMAVSWTDFFQGIIMFIGIIIVPVIGVSAAGGFENLFSSIGKQNTHLLSIFTKNDGLHLTWITSMSLLAWGLGYFGQPHILARFMAIRNPHEINDARKIAMIWVFVSLVCAIFVGILGIVLINPPLEKAASETVFILLVHKLVPSVLAGFVLSGILAAIMSTADSQLLVTSSALTEDIYSVFVRRNAPEKELVRVGRFTVLAVAVIAFFIAMDPDSSVLELVAYAWAGFGSAFGPLIIFSLYWKRMTERGAIAGIITGGLTVLIWKNLSGGIFELYEMAPGFLLSVISIIVFSLTDKQPSAEISGEFESISKV